MQSKAAMTDSWQLVARVSELEPEYPKRVEVGTHELALYLVDGTVFATSDVCTHAYARLSDGHNEGFEIFCPLHGGSFDVRTGEVLNEPCTEPVAVYECRVNGDSVLVKLRADD
jgi:nitrite reductase/ring-hydroxylating ferredoxin subunit